MATLDITTADGIKALSETLGWVDVRAYGAKGDGVTDDTVAIQATIDSLSTTGGLIVFPRGTYIISSTLTIGACYPYPVNIIGAGQRLSVFQWAGNNSTPMLDLQGVRDSYFKDFRILATTAKQLNTAIQSQTIFGRVSTNNNFERILIDGFAGGANRGIDNAFVFIPGTAGDANNAEMTFEKVTVYYCTNAAFSFQHTQSYAHNFYDPVIYGCDYGIRTDEGGGGIGGSFNVNGGSIGGITHTIFQLGAASNPISINGVTAQDHERFLLAGGSGATWPIRVCNCEINPTAATLHADRRVIWMQCVGPLILLNNHFGTSNCFPRVMSQADPRSTVVAVGNVFYNDFNTTGDTTWLEASAFERKEFLVGNSRLDANGQNSYWDESDRALHYDSGVPTTGTWSKGDVVWNTLPASGGAPGWVCTTSGTFSASTDNTGDTDGSTAVITGLTANPFSVGEYVTVSAGFPTTGPYRIMAKSGLTITLEIASDAAVNNITVATPDPVFKAMANLA